MTNPAFSVRPIRRLSAMLGALACTMLVGAASPLPESDPTHDVNARQGDHTSFEQSLADLRADRVNLELAIQPGEPFAVQVPFDGQWVTLALHPHSVRASDHRVWVQLDDGSLVEMDPGPVNTYRGEIAEIPGSIVSAGLLSLSGDEGDFGLDAMLLLPDDSRWIIEPIAGRLAGAAHREHIVYDSRDAECDHGTFQFLVPPDGQWNDDGQEAETQGGIAGLTCHTVNIGIDIDFDFVQIWNGETGALNRVNNVMNNVNTIYENEVGIIHLISEIIVRTSAGANPYTCPSNDSAGALLNSFRNVWRTTPESQIQRNVAHLFTGCTNIDALGVAWLSTVCQGIHGFHYGLTRHQSFMSCFTKTAAHELGHNWSATHCNGLPGCSGTIMQTGGGCGNTFAQVSIDEILTYKNSTSGSCKVPCEPQPPSNNTCQGSVIVNQGTTAFTNVLATTDGPEEPELCNFAGDANIQSDVWFRHTATCTGDLTVSLCDDDGGSADFDSKIAVYGAPCPGSPGTAIACNKDSCGDQSSVTIPVTEGQVIRIRVGGHNGAEGEGVLSVFCNESQAPACPADLTGDGVVDIFDLLDVLAAWGECDGCSEDITGDGVVDIFDLLEVLAAWGPCEE